MLKMTQIVSFPIISEAKPPPASAPTGSDLFNEDRSDTVGAESTGSLASLKIGKESNFVLIFSSIGSIYDQNPVFSTNQIKMTKK